MRGVMIAFCVFLAYIANSMIARADAAAYGVPLLDLLLRAQMIANPGKTRNSHLIDTRNQKSVPQYITVQFDSFFTFYDWKKSSIKKTITCIQFLKRCLINDVIVYFR